jgi:hypothetical protein
MEGTSTAAAGPCLLLLAWCTASDRGSWEHGGDGGRRVAAASAERAFSAMNFVKNKRKNSMEDQYLNDCLVLFNVKGFFLCVADEDIITIFKSHLKATSSS